MASNPEIKCAHAAVVPLADLRPNPKNPNRHSDSQISLLAKNIRQLGWRHPVIVSKRSGFVVAGHARIEAARLIGCQSVPVDYQDFASESEETAYLIADNRIAELAERDNAAIKDLISELDTGEFDFDLTGYDHEALENLMTQSAPAEKIEELKPIKKLHVLISMTSDQGIALLPKIQELAETAGATVYNAGN